MILNGILDSEVSEEGDNQIGKVELVGNEEVEGLPGGAVALLPRTQPVVQIRKQCPDTEIQGDPRPEENAVHPSRKMLESFLC